jgi:hypothetical protein
MAVALAETEQQARELIRSCSAEIAGYILDGEFDFPPEVYESGKAFVFWADVSDIDETGGTDG